MKFIVVILLLVLGALFVPRYELMVLDDPFGEDYHMVESFVLGEEKCREAKHKPEYSDLKPVCIRMTSWGDLSGTGSKYRSARILLTE